MCKSSLAHEPDGHNASGNTHIDARVLQLLGGLVRVVRDNLRSGMSKGIFCWISLLTKSLNLFQLLASQSVDVLVECQRVPLLIVSVMIAGRTITKVNSDYKQAGEAVSRGASDFQQFEIDGHSDHRVNAHGMKLFDFVFSPDTAGHNQLLVGGTAQFGNHIERHAQQQSLGIDIGVEKGAAPELERPDHLD